MEPSPTDSLECRELRARIRAQLRRHSGASPLRLTLGTCEIDFDRAELHRGGEQIPLTARELRLLEVFVRNPGRVLTRDQLIDAAWGRDMAITDRVVDTQVFNLRKKIEAIPAEPFPRGRSRPGLSLRSANEFITEI